jgi:3-hydroxyisobutyrate dehydrogenase-like beta-hydroxyacid dehydrogenase
LEVGFIGLGRMGLAMARSLIAAGHELAVHDLAAQDRGDADVDALAGSGARVASRIAEVCNADAVITMLASDDDIETAVFGRAGVIEAMPAGATHLAMSATGVELGQRLALAHRRAGQFFVAAPVLGSPEAAADGRLFILAAGGTAAVARCRPLFAALAQRSFLLGPEHATACLLHRRLKKKLARSEAALDAAALGQLIEMEVDSHRKR